MPNPGKLTKDLIEKIAKAMGRPTVGLYRARGGGLANKVAAKFDVSRVTVYRALRLAGVTSARAKPAAKKLKKRSVS